ncbi:MAG: hypothetical protein J0L92_18855 [Deltaproteobacteria bacterium]|nr:hypothetical protein [Deltaproteobacteria bacterium]
MSSTRLRRAQRLGVIGALVVLPACSVVVSDIGGIPPDPEGCIQQPELRANPRDLSLVLASMEPHGSQKTVATIVRRQSGMVQGRVILLPTGAGALGPRRLVLEERPTSADGLQCRLAEGSTLDVLLRVPRAVPPDQANEGPYQIDFWSDLNRTGGRVEAFPADHSWSANVCDNGTFLFTHNTGFETLLEASEAGTFRFTANPDAAIALFARASPRIDDGAIIPPPQQALYDDTVERLHQLPFVVRLERQGITVGELVTELECLVQNDMGQVTLAIPGVVDGGNFHNVQIYFDTQRNGQFDMDCDPSCVAAVEQTAADGSLALEFTPNPTCNFPDGFHQGSPGEPCAIIEAPSITAFLSSAPSEEMMSNP